MRHYKIASELRRAPRQPHNCFRIPENEPTGEIPNIFDDEELERVPDGFAETAKDYELVGARLVKFAAARRDKRKLLRKNTESASSRQSKCSSSLPTLDRGLVSKESLLERVKRLEDK